MSSVLETHSLLRISHQSFSDYLLDDKACSPAFHINLDNWSQALAIACLNTMEAGLKFNICGLDSSYIRNESIPNLTSRVETYIHPELLYSCRFWTEHLSDSQYDDELYLKIQGFMDNRFLYWLEVLSLCKQMNQASGILGSLSNWISVSFLIAISHRDPRNNHLDRVRGRITRSSRI
jgi:hypothetical protein